MEPVHCHAAGVTLRSIVSAVAVVRPPPAYRIFPGRYITAEP